MERPEPANERRRCPLCRAPTNERVCPKDGTPTLVKGAPHIDPRDLPKGTVISGRYRIDRVLGKGAFGTVFAGTHALTGQDVAIKILAPSGVGDDERGVLRFFHEARVTAKLSHANTVRVFDFGQDDTGLVYLVMEFLAGVTLREELFQRMQRGESFTELEVVDIAIAVTRSLGEAHAHALVHRDLKPENVMLQRVLGDAPQIKVLDFGIVKQSSTALTAAGQIPCTPAYASPEQVTADTLDGRSDLYTLGIVMFELLTGDVPFSASSTLELLQAQVRTKAPDVRLKARVPVSPAVADVIARALAKLPAERFADAAEMRAALEGTRSRPPLMIPDAQTAASPFGYDDTRITPRELDAGNDATAPGAPPQDPAELTGVTAISGPKPPMLEPIAEAPRMKAGAWVWIGGGLLAAVVALMALAAKMTVEPTSVAVPVSTPVALPVIAVPTPVAVPVIAVPTPIASPIASPIAPPPSHRPSPARRPRPSSALDVELPDD